MFEAFIFWLMRPLAEPLGALILFIVLGGIWVLITLGGKR